MGNVSTIKAKREDKFRSWVFLASDRNNTPRILFTTNVSELQKKNNRGESDSDESQEKNDSDESQEKSDSDAKVSLILRINPEAVVTVEFGDSTAANDFYKFVDDLFA